MYPFTDIRVQPTYGKHRAMLTWTVDPSLAGGDFFVYRSPDGAGNWELLNTTPVTVNEYEDLTLNPGNLLDTVHYRILCQKNSVDYESPIIGIYNRLRRKEYAVCSKIMKMEFLQLSRADGIKMLVYKPLQRGEYSDQVDPDTEQHTGVACTATPDSENSFDQLYKGGYSRPHMTLVRLSDTGPLVIIDRQDGLTTRDKNMVQARFLGFPHITPGDMVVNPETDERYGVTDTVKAYKFKGVFPVAFDAKMELISRKDPRYLVPLPATLPPIVPREP